MTSPPVGPLQALRELCMEGIFTRQLQLAQYDGPGPWADVLRDPEYRIHPRWEAALVSVEEQLAALQRSLREMVDAMIRYSGEVDDSAAPLEHRLMMERAMAALARGSSPSSPKGDA